MYKRSVMNPVKQQHCLEYATTQDIRYFRDEGRVCFCLPEDGGVY